ncbi:MAG: ribonuclease HI [Acutalibacteraceae bacterium]|jgi:ribonuclease HI|nr:ribonuclease HI [Clostridiales bacterium]
MDKNLSFVQMFTDGACSGNPGPGGWGTILRCNGVEKELSGGERETTNNRMELTAVIEGFKSLKRSCNVELYTDSKYVADSIEKGWVYSWKKNGWKKSDKKPALNSDLWEELINEIEKHNLKIIWVKGHAGHPENERCDQMAVEETKKFM